jgi:uncharacterized protein YacL
VSEVETIPEDTARALRLILFAMAAGLCLLAAVIGFFYARSSGVVPGAARVRIENAMTMIAMAVAASLIVVSEAVWRGVLRGTKGALAQRVQTAFIVRAALREGAALFGLVVALLCAQSGLLRLYPAYWANFAPFGLFLVFARLHWPTVESLAAEAAEILPR